MGAVRETILNMKIAALTAKTRVKNIQGESDKIFLKDGKFSGKWNLSNIWEIYAVFRYEYFGLL